MADRSIPVSTIESKRNYCRHGLTNHPDYYLWAGMVDRCTKPWNKSFPKYGGRGIKICKEWMNFKVFLSDMGSRPAGRSLDRIDNNGNYEPANCRWATKKEQQNNTRRCRFLSIGKQTKTMTQWANETKLSITTIRKRVKRGWSDIKILTTPPRSKQPRRADITLHLPPIMAEQQS